MPYVREKHNSGRLEDVGGEISLVYEYYVFGVSTEGAAYWQIATTTPPVLMFQGRAYRRHSITVEPVAAAWEGREVWEGRVVYQQLFHNVTLEYQGTSGAATARVTVSREVVGAYSPPGTVPPDLGGVIGFDGEDVQGCEIIVPQPEFSISVEPVPVTDPNAFLRTVSMMAGRVNANSYLGFYAGELLLAGADITGATDKPFRVTYRFQASPNLWGVRIGGIYVPFKRGWDYLDVYYGRAFDTQSRTLVRRPRAVYVHRVYDYVPFVLPGIDV